MGPMHGLRWAACLCALLVAPLAWGQEETAAPGFDWSLDPVFEQNEVDGWLLGLRAGVDWAGVQPFASLAYGLDSGGFRHQLGVDWQGWRGSWFDWPGRDVLGRAGETGGALALTLPLGRVELKRVGLWPTGTETQGPEVVYAHLHHDVTLEGAFDLGLRLAGDGVWGMGADGRPFSSMRHDLKLRWGDLRVQLGSGTSSNAAELPAFEFTQHLRGYDDPLRGDAFFRARVERRVPLLYVPLKLQAVIPAPAPADAPPAPDIDFRVDLSAFAEALSVHTTPSALLEGIAEPGTESLLGWGGGLVFGATLDDFEFEFRVDWFFDRSGQMKPLFG